jgi:hypothetical protein
MWSVCFDPWTLRCCGRLQEAVIVGFVEWLIKVESRVWASEDKTNFDSTSKVCGTSRQPALHKNLLLPEMVGLSRETKLIGTFLHRVNQGLNAKHT